MSYCVVQCSGGEEPERRQYPQLVDIPAARIRVAVVRMLRRDDQITPDQCLVCGEQAELDSHTCGRIDCQENLARWSADQW